MASSRDLVQIFSSFGSITLETPSTPTNSISKKYLEAPTLVTSTDNIGVSLDFLMNEMLAIAKNIVQEL